MHTQVHIHMKAFFMSLIVLVYVSGIFIRAEEAALGLRVQRGRHRLSGAVEPLVCLHWWEEGRLELLWLGATERERDRPGGLNGNGG